MRALYKSFSDQNTLAEPWRDSAMTKTLKPTWAAEGPKRTCKLAPLYFDNMLSNDRLPLMSPPLMMKRSPSWM